MACFVRLAAVGLLFGLLCGSAAPAAPLLTEDFQTGPGKFWAAASKDAQVVPVDPAKPDGPRALRFTQSGQMLAGPLVKPGDWKTAAAIADKLEAWSDYKLSFRFRLGKVPEVPVGFRGRALDVLSVCWRVNPAEDNPQESYRLYFRVDRYKKQWVLEGPRVLWNGKEEMPDLRDEMGPAGGVADTQWHTFELTVQGDTMSTMFDKDFHMRVRDGRIPSGVIALQSGWGKEVSPGYVDVADIRVEPLGGGGAAVNADQRRQQALTRGCLLAYYPSGNELWTMVNFDRSLVRDRKAVAEAGTFRRAKVYVLPADGEQVLGETELEIRNGRSDERKITLPPLKGDYRVRFTLDGAGQPITLNRPLERKSFPWEGNNLGITDEIYPPFTPVQAGGPDVAVVSRQHRMNAFGLWDSLKSLDRELLAEPMRLRYETAEGEGKWDPGEIKQLSATPQAAVYQGAISAPEVSVAARSTLEFDGCMKVEMALSPGERPREIRRLWIDIPLKNREAPLFHTYVDGIRINYAGAMPAGSGSIWDSRKADRYGRRGEWLNSFCTYIWMGAEERGLAWFAENDRGWLTAKDDGKAAVQEIVREGDRLTLRVYLINTPSTLSARRELVFGLQASPVKPMPADWRLKSDKMPSISGPVNPWGGLSCSYKGPHRGDWTIVDKISAGQKTGKFDDAWLADYVKRYNPPPIYGEKNWAENTRYFVNKWGVPRRPRPALVYAEEMAACTMQAEWWTFQDEWTMAAGFTQRPKITEDIFRTGSAPVSARSSFPRSYQDYALWYHNEWLKRGIGIYWDNCHTIASANPRVSAAYVTDNGRVQPAVVLWNQREYSKRAWNLLNYWKRNQSDEVIFSMHRTNTQMLPVHGWATVSLDLEWSARYSQAFPPEEVRTTVMGRQTGVYGTDHRALFGTINPAMRAMAKERPDWPGRASWGMRMVHELGHRTTPTPGFDKASYAAAEMLEKRVVDFGYGKSDVAVHNYWADAPALNVDSDQVKWIALARPADKTVLVALQSWSADPVTVKLAPNAAALGFEAGRKLVDAETGKDLGRADTAVVLDAAYGTRVIRIDPSR